MKSSEMRRNRVKSCRMRNTLKLKKYENVFHSFKDTED